MVAMVEAAPEEIGTLLLEVRVLEPDDVVVTPEAVDLTEVLTGELVVLEDPVADPVVELLEVPVILKGKEYWKMVLLLSRAMEMPYVA
jgi:hypothetical protein